jgi:hypothetical protein
MNILITANVKFYYAICAIYYEFSAFSWSQNIPKELTIFHICNFIPQTGSANNLLFNVVKINILLMLNVYHSR